jgi:hypothetical protein
VLCVAEASVFPPTVSPSCRGPITKQRFWSSVTDTTSAAAESWQLVAKRMEANLPAT